MFSDFPKATKPVGGVKELPEFEPNSPVQESKQFNLTLYYFGEVLNPSLKITLTLQYLTNQQHLLHSQ